MTPDANDLCVFAIKRGDICKKEIYCNLLYPFYISLMDRYHKSPYYSGSMSKYLYVNPKTDCTGLLDTTSVSFVPMTNIKEQSNIVEYDIVPYSSVKKGFTIFKKGDMIWAKITPCMQNGKSCIVEDMPTEVGFGSTEFHVIRKKTDQVYMPFIWSIFSNDNVLKAAQAVFSGSAGQQRVSQSFLENFPCVVPDYDIQVALTSRLELALLNKKQKLKQAEKVRDNSILELESALNLSFCKAEQELFSYVCLENIKRNSTKRIDPKCYSVKFKKIRSAIDCSNYPKFKLRDLILDITGGDWGYEPEAEKENCQKCLVLRATEISNKDNIEIREDKAQYRQIDKKKLTAMNVEIGDIIIEKSGGSIDQPVGRVIYVDQLSYNGYPIAYSNFLTKLKINKNLVDSYYLFEYLHFVYKIGLTEVMQNQTNGIRNLIIDEFLDQTVIVPPNHYEIGQKIKAQRLSACEIEKQAEIEWQAAKEQFEKELLTEH